MSDEQFGFSGSGIAARPADRVIALILRISTPATALIAIAHFILFAYFLQRTAILSPISDSFAYIGDYLQFRAGQTPLPDYLWQAHGEHHLLWIRLLTWADVAIFHVRGIATIAAASVAIVATAILLWLALRRAEPKLGAATNLGLLVPMLVLGAANVTDCSVPINTTYTFTLFFVVLALVLFAGAEDTPRRALLRRMSGLLAAIGASMGTAAGLLAWPILSWMAWRDGRPGWMAALIALGIAYSLFYLHGLDFIGFAPALGKSAASFVAPSHLGKLTDYFFTFLGLPFTRDAAFDAIGRVIGVALFLAGTAAVLIATFSGRLATPLDRIAVGLILLAFGSAVLAAIGRGDLIDDVKVPVRYTMFATAMHAGLLCIVLPRAARYFETAPARAFLSSSGLVFALALLALQIFIGRSAVQIANVIARDADCFIEETQTKTVNPIVTRWPQHAQRLLTDLRRQDLLALRSRDCTDHSSLQH